MTINGRLDATVESVKDVIREKAIGNILGSKEIVRGRDVRHFRKIMVITKIFMITKWASAMVSSVLAAPRDLKMSFQTSTTLFMGSALDQLAPIVICKLPMTLGTLIP